MACTGYFIEWCSGFEYSVTCECPQATCACQAIAPAYGTPAPPSTTSVKFAGCPACPTPQQMLTLCGFPQ